MRAWFSEAEYRRAVKAAVPPSLPMPSDAVFDEVTAGLLASGIVVREIRHGIPGFAVTMDGLAISGIRMGH